MGQMIESVKVVNSVVRTLLVLVGLGGLGWAGWFGYSTYYDQELLARKQAEQIKEAEKSIVRLKETVATQTQEIERLDTAMRLLKVDHRVARLDVIDQRKDAAGKMTTVVEFVELNDEGSAVEAPRRFEIIGDVIYLDNWIVKFDDKYVETAEIDRSTSIVLFRRLFGEHQEPKDGFPLDRGQGPPRAYTRGGVVSDFEKRIWSEFWTIANDESKAKEMGIRAAHGQAVSFKAEKGKSYPILLRASDGLSVGLSFETPPKKSI